MKRTWTIIGVADVPRSFKWYQSLLGLPETAPAHDYFGQIVSSDGTVPWNDDATTGKPRATQPSEIEPVEQ